MGRRIFGTSPASPYWTVLYFIEGRCQRLRGGCASRPAIRTRPARSGPGIWKIPRANSNRTTSGLANSARSQALAVTWQTTAHRDRKKPLHQTRKPRPLPGIVGKLPRTEAAPLAGQQGLYFVKARRSPRMGLRKPQGSVEIQSRTWKHLGTDAPRGFLRVPWRGSTSPSCSVVIIALCSLRLVTSVPFSLGDTLAVVNRPGIDSMAV